MAKGRNMAAIRLVMERVLPPRRERPIHFEMPQLKTVEDAASAIACIFEGVGQGQLSESEARTLNGLVDSFLETRAHVDLERRLKNLEEIKSAIEEKALEVREHHTNRFQAGFTKRGPYK